MSTLDPCNPGDCYGAEKKLMEMPHNVHVDLDGNGDGSLDFVCPGPGEYTVTFGFETSEGFTVENIVVDCDCAEAMTTDEMEDTGSPDTDGDPDAGSSSSTTGDDPSSDSGSSSDSTGETTMGGDPGIGECAQPCSVDTDCGTPTEESCVDGLCVNDCMNKGCSYEEYTCAGLGVVSDCVIACQTDADCGTGRVCQGIADDGATFCIDFGYNGCVNDTDCVESPRGSICNVTTGLCGCSEDAECANAIWGFCAS